MTAMQGMANPQMQMAQVPPKLKGGSKAVTRQDLFNLLQAQQQMQPPKQPSYVVGSMG